MPKPKPARRYPSANPKEHRPTIAITKQPFSGTYVPYRRCTCGRRAYVSRQDAKTVKKEMTRKYPSRAGEARVFRCEANDRSWHVGAAPTTEEDS